MQSQYFQSHIIGWYHNLNVICMGISMIAKEKEWNLAYQDGGNIVFYPCEEYIRYVSKYIKKRTGINEFQKIRTMNRCLDIGCGMGRHINWLDDMGFEVDGIELSEVAVGKAKEWFDYLGKSHLKNHIKCGSILDVPFENKIFDFAISVSVLDSMDFEIAQKGIIEVARLIRGGGYFMFDVIMNQDMTETEEIVQTKLEHGTIQSYFSINKITKMLNGFFDILETKIIDMRDENLNFCNRRAYIISERTKKAI